LLTITRPPNPTPFPYTTLFRSQPLPPGPRRAPRRAAPPHDRPRLPLPRRRPPPAPQRDRVRRRPHRQPVHGALARAADGRRVGRSEEHTSELQSRENLVCRLLL